MIQNTLYNTDSCAVYKNIQSSECLNCLCHTVINICSFCNVSNICEIAYALLLHVIVKVICLVHVKAYYVSAFSCIHFCNLISDTTSCTSYNCCLAFQTEIFIKISIVYHHKPPFCCVNLFFVIPTDCYVRCTPTILPTIRISWD